jgi:predicted PhzF superfamily epimerase YddE/YHI9
MPDIPIRGHMGIPYYHVDCFADALFSGNPAGVCICPAFPGDAVMRSIAAENRHSDTAFVVYRPDGDLDLRWFTPAIEDDLCGHATLAAAFVLARRHHDVWPVRFHTRSGLLTVARAPDGFELDFPARPPLPAAAPRGLLPALGVTHATVMKSWRDYLVVVDDAERVRALSPDISALRSIDLGTGGGAVVTAPGEDDVDYVCRLFAPGAGIPEDPATGSIQCALAPYWGEQLGRTRLRVRQLSARGGRMRCTVAGDRVKIAGNAQLYLEGTIEMAETDAAALVRGPRQS